MKSDGVESASQRKQNQFLRLRRKVVPQTTLDQLTSERLFSIRLNANPETLETKGRPRRMLPVLQSKEMPGLSRSTLL
jgi:hypothetical protein